ncbi:unannotated protein [freshwater metagenome]|uniref:Unannotated protein n=1 Tax=freshwater metagenome TaxID=449393 RepID=A0A6J6DRL3_9ZZZZ
MDCRNDVGPSFVENLVAPFELHKVIEGEFVLLQHRAHGTVGNDDAFPHGLKQGARTRRH